MKGLYVFGIISFMLFGLVATASADRTMYFSGKIGGNIPSDTHLGTASVSSDPGFSLTGALGIEFEKPFRLEGELGVFSHAYEGRNSNNNVRFSGYYDMVNFMVNGYWDFRRDKPINPYVGIGGGFSVVHVDFTSIGIPASDVTTVGAVQGIVGLEYKPNPRFALLAEYRYFITSDPDFGTTGVPFSTEYDAHHFLIGARFFFGGK